MGTHTYVREHSLTFAHGMLLPSYTCAYYLCQRFHVHFIFFATILHELWIGKWTREDSCFQRSLVLFKRHQWIDWVTNAKSSQQWIDWIVSSELTESSAMNSLSTLKVPPPHSGKTNFPFAKKSYHHCNPWKVRLSGKTTYPLHQGVFPDMFQCSQQWIYGSRSHIWINWVVGSDLSECCCSKL